MGSLNSQDQFGEGDSSKIDKVIAASPIAGYVGGVKMLKTLKGNVDVEDPTVFEALYEKYRKSHTDVEKNPDEVPGFVDRGEKQPIKLRLPGRNSNRQLVTAATVEAAVHEVMHLNSATNFQQDFGHAYNEGVTEYFTELVLGSGKAYRDQLELAKGLITGLDPNGESAVAKAYFNQSESHKLKVRIAQAFGTANGARDYLEWQHRGLSDNPQDWKVAKNLLETALKNPATVPASSGAGSGSGSGSGSAGRGSGGASAGSGSGGGSAGSGSGGGSGSR
jgi:uncharacterized membrane protein YgcG